VFQTPFRFFARRQRKSLNLKKLLSITSLTLGSTVAICQEEEVLTVATVPNDIETKVIQTLDPKKVNSEADTNVLEAEIDQLVYELYGLTEGEIAIVEQSTN
jgi:ABC-type oligopeptide transport system substrate-binding subunit